MARYPRVREQHVAVFGGSGSGKTVLVSSFFGATQQGAYKNDLWDLVAEDAGQGHRLYQNYLGMRDRAVAPMTTRFSATTYRFSVKLKGGSNESAKRRPFDVLRLAWHDYPGEWFESEPSSASETDRRTDTFHSLLKSDVALLLVDAQQLLAYPGEEERYLKLLLGNLCQGLMRLKDGLLAEDGPLVEFPRIWILALSKADLLSHWDVNDFRDLVILKAAEDISRLRSTLQELVDTPAALSVGEDFLLLSSAKFELSSENAEPVAIDLRERKGVDLVLPIAALLPLERRVQWEEKLDIPRKVLDSLADGAETLASAMMGGRFATFESLLGRAGKAGRVARRAMPLLAEAATMAGPKLRAMNEQARAQNDYLRATLTQFKQDLEEGARERILRTAK